MLFIIIPLLILAIAVHEYSHARMAHFLGDDTAKRLGRLTLDPLKHIDPIWTIALPAVVILMATISATSGIPLFAAGKPTPYNPSMLTRKWRGKTIPVRYAELLVAIAGPLSNLALAFISLLIILFLSRFGYDSVTGIFQQFIYLNVALFVFNLIPVPPLDGSKILVAFLPGKAAEKYEMMGAQLSWILLGVLIFGGGAFIGYAIRAVVSGMTWLLI